MVILVNYLLITKKNIFFYKNSKNKKIYLIIFIISISICTIILFYLLYSFFSKLKQKEKTNILKSKYNISTLYSSNIKYTSLKLSSDISIIGLIEIPKINISYPILENINEKLLKVSVCKFSGPFPNRMGNLCIAGHNYKNTLMFSKLYMLDINDSIYITDLNSAKLEYIVYDKFKVKENNLQCTANSKNIEITLITCNNNNNSERIVIKAKVKG